jgi:hypothetical protein
MGITRIRDVTLSLDTSAYANGDVLADTQVITEALRTVDGTGQIRSINVLDEDDQTAYTFNVLFLDSSASIGTENSAFSITDANARSIFGVATFATAESVDLINSRLYWKNGLAIPIKAISGTASLGIALAVITGTPTHTAAGIKIRLGIEWD